MQGESIAAGQGFVAGQVCESKDDNFLVAALAAGDKSALAALYDRHASLLMMLGLRVLGDRTTTEDVLHDVFVEAWRHAADFDPARGTVRAWLVTRMRSRALDRRSSHARQARLAAEVKREGGSFTLPASEAGADLDSERVREQVGELPPDLGSVIELAYFEGLSSAEIAGRLTIPVGTVKSRTSRALTALRKVLKT